MFRYFSMILCCLLRGDHLVHAVSRLMDKLITLPYVVLLISIFV